MGEGNHVKIESFRKGREGHGSTHYALRRVSDSRYMDKQGHFTQFARYDADTLLFDDEGSARTHAEAANLVVED